MNSCKGLLKDVSPLLDRVNLPSSVNEPFLQKLCVLSFLRSSCLFGRYKLAPAMVNGHN